MKVTKRTYLFLGLAVLLLGGTAYGFLRAFSQPTPQERYRLQTVEKGDITQSVAANGTLNPVVLVNVGTQVSGTVTKLFVDFNDKVEKGEPLLELDRSLLEAQSRQSEASIGNIQATLDLARANEARMQALFKEEYVSRQELDQAIQARRSAEAQLRQATAAADKDKVNLGFTLIRSPVSGIVVDRVVDIGQTVAASLQTPTLIKIAQDLSEQRLCKKNFYLVLIFKLAHHLVMHIFFDPNIGEHRHRVGFGIPATHFVVDYAEFACFDSIGIREILFCVESVHFFLNVEKFFVTS